METASPCLNRAYFQCLTEVSGLSATFEKRPSYWSEQCLRVVGEGITDNETLIIGDVAYARLGPVRENWCNTRAQNDPQKRKRINKRGIYGNHDG
jgi:hypothetical protein